MSGVLGVTETYTTKEGNINPGAIFQLLEQVCSDEQNENPDLNALLAALNVLRAEIGFVDESADLSSQDYFTKKLVQWLNKYAPDVVDSKRLHDANLTAHHPDIQKLFLAVDNEITQLQEAIQNPASVDDLARMTSQVWTELNGRTQEKAFFETMRFKADVAKSSFFSKEPQPKGLEPGEEDAHLDGEPEAPKMLH